MNCLRTITVFALMLAALVVYPRHVAGQRRMINREAELKAKLVLILSRFVTWPPAAAPGANAPLKIGILGQDPFVQDGVNHLERAMAAGLVNKTVTIERFAKIEDYVPCQILVVSRTEDGKSAFAEVQQKPVLGIGESPGLARQGAVINLVVVENKIIMEVNPDVAKRSRLEIDPRIYRLPSVVIIRGLPPAE
jgi:hypothetical protein